MFQILFTSQRLKYFCNFSRCSRTLRNIGKFQLYEISWLQNNREKAENIDQIITDSTHMGSIKKIQPFMDERYPLQIYCHGTEITGICLKIDVLKLLRAVKRPLCISCVRSGESLLLDERFSPSHFTIITFL